MNDVVKTKSKTKFILTLILQSFLLYEIFHTGFASVKNLYNLSLLNEKTNVTIQKIYWQNPEIYALIKESATKKNRCSIEKVHYIKARTLAEFESFQKNFEGMSFVGYGNKTNPKILKIDKKIEFQQMIRCFLFICFYILLEIILISAKRFSILNFFAGLFSKKKKISIQKLFT